MDRAAHSVLARLQQAAKTAEQNVQQALALAHQAKMQLRAAEDRVAGLEAECASYRERSERAEGWLQRITHQIDQMFPSREASQPEDYAPKRQGYRR
jgi:hypothetical protein